ncbi:MAG: CoA transferase, partial [Pseudomonadales bacterium]
GHPEWKEDERFKTPALRDLNANLRLEMTQTELLKRDAKTWLEVLEKAGVPCAPVLTRNQMIEHPQIAANELLFETQHPVAGKIRQARPAARFSGSQLDAPRPAPKHGQHTQAILKDAGYTETEIANLMTSGAAFES